MSREKQIEEIAKITSRDCGCCSECEYVGMKGDGVDCIDYFFANAIYNLGYRKQEWISVEERLPEECTHVIVHDEDGTVGEAFHSISDHFEWVANEKIAFVTHWMPLPNPPKGE